jgi:MarR-like DNA-binding transcriptional regulator SgrR of sgrS sRNA
MGSPCLARRRVFLASGERAACSALATVEHKVDGGENKEVERERESARGCCVCICARGDAEAAAQHFRLCSNVNTPH